MAEPTTTALPAGTPAGEGKTSSAAAELLDKSKQVEGDRGRTARRLPPPRGRGGRPQPAPAEERKEAAAEQRAEIFTDENTARLVQMPFLLWAVKADCQGLMLDEPETRELVATAKPTLNEWCPVAPRWVALGLFGVSLASIVTTKLIWLQAYKEQLRLERLKLERGGHGAAPPAPPPPGPQPGGSAPQPAPAQTPEQLAAAHRAAADYARSHGLQVREGAWVAGAHEAPADGGAGGGAANFAPTRPPKGSEGLFGGGKRKR